MSTDQCLGCTTWAALTLDKRIEITRRGNGVKCFCGQWLVAAHAQPVTLFKGEHGGVFVHVVHNEALPVLARDLDGDCHCYAREMHGVAHPRGSRAAGCDFAAPVSKAP